MNMGYLKGLSTAIPVLAALAAGPSAAQDVTIRWSNYLPTQHPMYAGWFKEWGAEVARVTEGRVVVEFGDAPLGPPNRQLDLVLDGVADASFGLHGFTPGRFELTKIAELPILAQTGEANSVAYWRVYESHLKDAGLHEDVVLLGLSALPAGVMWTAEGPIGSLDDVAGMKFVQAGGLVTEVVEAISGINVVTPPNGWYEALSNRIGDATLATVGSPNSFNLQRFLPHMTTVEGGFMGSSFFAVLSRDTWDRISPEDQALMAPLMGEHFSRRMGQTWDAIDRFGASRFAEHGVTVTAASPELTAQFRAAADPLIDQWVASIADTGVDGAAAVAAFREIAAAEQARLTTN